MDVHLTPEQEMHLAQIASATGRGTEEVAQEAITRFIDYDAWFRRQVQVGLDQIEHGEVLENDEVRGRLERMFRD